MFCSVDVVCIKFMIILILKQDSGANSGHLWGNLLKGTRKIQFHSKSGAGVVTIVWEFDSQLPMQSVPIPLKL